MDSGSVSSWVPSSLLHRPRARPGRLAVAAGMVLALMAGLPQVPASAAVPAAFAPPPAPAVAPVPVTEVTARAAAVRTAMTDATGKPAPRWPAAGTAVLDVSPSGAAVARVDALPVTLAAPAPEPAPARVRVEVVDHAATLRAGVRGLLMRVGRADGATVTGSVKLAVDYRSFATGYGADWASRLRLEALPACALSTPERRECVGRPLPSTNDLATGRVSATVAVPASTALVALTAGSSGPAGDFKATSLQASSTWSSGGNSGAFTWSYPMRVPPAVGGLSPEVGLSYSSQAVDGRHAASNNQPSWVGEGFEEGAGGFIERRYRACADDMDGSANNDEKTGDLCWETSNATLSLSGHSGELIYNAAENRWHLRSDDGSRIERRTGAANGDNDGEYWVVTTTNGVQYWFGSTRLPGWTTGDPVTNSTWTAPVFGNDPGEPCHATAFADSDCVQAWRWNLDYIVDVNGNSSSYWYTKETNRYARNNEPSDAAGYDRAGWLDHISFGTRRDNGVESVLDGPAPQQVVFGVADRCLSGCATHDESHWPDTPWDQECAASPCADIRSLTFWATKRLSTVTTQVHDAGGWHDVERWTLTHTFPDPGDGTRAGLWLSKISHVGLVGQTTTMPDIEFTGVQLSNRVDTIDFAAAMNWWRIAMIRNETGGTVSVTYSAQDCVAGQTPTPQTNTKRCYPVRWTPDGYPDPVTDWFHKYVVTTVYEQDNTGGVPPQGSPRVVYQYSYLDGAAWHYADDDGLIDPADKTWSDFRGYGRVGVTLGEVGEQTYTETRYFRGMHGDKASPSGGTRTVTIDGINDDDWFAGATRESKVFNGPGGSVVSRQTSEPWASGATATRTANADTVTARFTRTATTRGYTTLDAGRGERVTRSSTTFDSLGMAVAVDDFGQDGVSGDEQCTRTDYEPRNTAAWLLDRPHRVRTFAVSCDATSGPLGDADVIGDSRTTYDNQDYATAPVRGLPTRTELMAAWNAGAPTYTTVAQSAYDANGRVTSSWDAMGARTTTAYTPATGGPVTATTVTNPMLHTTTTTVEPAWGSPMSTVDPNGKRTDLTYDGLGRLTSVWRPGRDKATQTASLTFGYLLRTDAATVVTTAGLTPAGAYTTSYALYDGLLRPRQTQSPSPSGGRLLTDTFYDTAGRQVKKFEPYYALGAPGTTLVTATERTSVPNQIRAVYDGAGRGIASVFQPYDVERWRTSMYFAGDRADITPPAGATATSTVTDARGRTVARRQYHGPTPTPGTPGSWDTTGYTFNRKGQLTAVTDAAGNQWISTYDTRGRKTQSVDPDTGTTTNTYDNGDRLTSTVDARGRKLAFLYDPLGRERAVYDDQVGGTLRAQWIYDTIAKGQLTQSTRFVGSVPYQVKILGYNDQYQATGTQVVIPATETGVDGAYNFFNTYNVNGSLAATSLPGTGGDLAAETLSFGYDGMGQPITLSSLYGTTNLSYVAATAYNALGQTDQITLDTDNVAGGRVWESFTHELETGRLTATRVDRDTVSPFTVSDIRYSFDDTGNVTKAVDVAPDPADDAQCFGYDYLRRLTAAWTPASGNCATTPNASTLGGPAPYWHSWTFDTVGNRTTQTVHTTGGDSTSTNAFPSPTGVQPHALTSTSGARTAQYRYDEAGNTTCRPQGSAANTCPAGAASQTLTWDSEGHLETSVDATGTTTYVYDANGNRLIRRDPGGKTLYLPGEEIRYTTASATTATTRTYNFGNFRVAARTAAGLTWLGADHQGTAVVAVNAVSQATAVRRQNPYGNPRGTTPSWVDDKGFVGGTKDNTGLTHLGAREYDPTTGRFISVDPVFDQKDPQSWTGYAYASNTPMNKSDPSGLRPADCDGSCMANWLQGQRDAAAATDEATEVATGGSPQAHDTAIELRVLQLEAMYPGALISASIGGVEGPDLVCYNCAAIKSNGTVQEVWVWEITTEGQDTSGKATQLQGYVDQLKQDPLIKRGKQNVTQGPAFPAPAGPAMVNGLDNQVVTVRSSDKHPGLELYKVNDTGNVLAKSDPRREQAEKAYAMTYEKNKKFINFYRNMTDPSRLGTAKDDPVTGWAIAGGIGVAAAVICWFLCPALPAVAEATPFADAIEEWLASNTPILVP